MTRKLTIRSKLAAALAIPLVAVAAAVIRQVADAQGSTNADPTVATWSLLTETQYAVAIVAEPSVGNTPINESGTTFGSERRFVAPLGTNRAFSQAIVSGNELFVTTDSTDVNLATYGSSPGTGAVRRHALTGGAQVGSTQDITGGASSAEVTGDKGNLVIGSGTDARRMDVQDTFGQEIGAGRTIEIESEGATTRLLWLGG